MEQTRRNSAEFLWTRFRTVDELLAVRLSAMSAFLEDFGQDTARPRYIPGSLPMLPFPDKTFELALCSHFLFLYSEHFDAAFHV